MASIAQLRSSARFVILLIMGVAGSGKTTIANLLGSALACAVVEGDDLHPEENIEKMRRGMPLSDEDRLPWLREVAAQIDAWRRRGESGVIACSALKRAYRDIIIGERSGVTLVYLKGDDNLISRRMIARREHFMPLALLESQFAALEEPTPDEKAIVVDVGRRPDEVVAAIIGQLGAATTARALQNFPERHHASQGDLELVRRR
jgi:gluconokinase